MILTTTPTVEGKTISKYLGIVTGFDSSASWPKNGELNHAVRELQNEAAKLDADAIIGINIAAAKSTSQNVGNEYDFPMLCVIGTAVKLK